MNILLKAIISFIASFQIANSGQIKIAEYYLNCEVDLDCLAEAVAWQETHDCTTGVGKSKNNCFGMRGGNGFFYYETKKDSYEAFKKLWSDKNKWYKCRMPNINLARTYSGNDNAERWLNNVMINYNKCININY